MKIKKTIKAYLRKRLNDKYYIQNLNIDIENEKQKKVLICYLDYTALHNLEHIMHPQIYEFSIMIKYFLSQNYCIDICPYNYEYQERIKDDYDIIIGLGATFRTAVQKNTLAKKILYLTENPPLIAEQLEKARVDYFYERKGKKIPLERSGVCFVESDLYIADYRICGSNQPNTFFLYFIGLKNQNFSYDGKRKNKYNFLWFGGPAAIHKGLDICMDIFERHKEWNLYVAGITEKKLKTYGIHEGISNVHFLGFLDVNSKEYIDIVNETVFMILPSCSESYSTAVLTSMRHGLVPIVCQNNGFDEFEDLVFILKDYHIEYVEKEIIRILEDYSMEELEKRSKEIMEFADTNFSMGNYRKELYQILDLYVNVGGGISRCKRLSLNHGYMVSWLMILKWSGMNSEIKILYTRMEIKIDAIIYNTRGLSESIWRKRKWI